MPLDVREFDLNSIGPDFIEDPHPTLHALRRIDPVHRNADGSVYLTRYADCLIACESSKVRPNEQTSRQMTTWKKQHLLCLLFHVHFRSFFDERRNENRLFVWRRYTL